MASRQEEKERRRRERLEAERAAAAAAARARHMRTLGGIALAAIAVVAVVIAVASSGGGAGPRTGAEVAGPGLPRPRITSLPAAARAARCQIHDYGASAYNDRGHTQSSVTYRTNPPAFGPHNPIPASDGDYVGVVTPAKEHLVHALEHGRIEIQYGPGLARAHVRQLESLFGESAGAYGPGQYVLLFANGTHMPYAVAAVAWTHILGCPAFNSRVFDAIRAFRVKWTLKAPELITQAE